MIPNIISAGKHILLIGAAQCGQLNLAVELAKAVKGRTVHVLEANPTNLDRFLEEAPVPIVVRDFSTRLLPVANNDPWLTELAPALLANRPDAVGRRMAYAVLTVAHSGASGRESPDAKLFDEVWTVREGFTYRDQMPHARENHEIALQRPGRPTLYFRSRADAVTFDLIQDERLAS